MRRPVVWPEVRLNLHQAAGEAPAAVLADEHLAEEFAGNPESVACEKVWRKDGFDACEFASPAPGQEPRS